ncbi:MAG: winged helix-turn-helix domain-containing protein, partial [Acidobacteriota bacterium]
IITFDQFEFDRRTGELKSGGTRIRVPSQSIEVLCALLEGGGDVVTRDELRQRLWPADTFVDFEHGLNSAVRRLRDALGDSADKPKYIETLPRRGYRYIGARPADIETPFESAPAPALTPPQASTENRRSALAGSANERPRQTRWLWLTIGAGATALAVGAGALVVQSTLGQSGREAEWSAPVRLTFDDGLQTEPSLSADGQSVAYTAGFGGNFDIWTRRIAGGNPVQVTAAPADDWQPDWSPDGESLVFRSERGGGGLFVVPATGGAEEKVADFGFRPLWAPDGKHIVFARSILAVASSSLCVTSLDGRTPRDLPLEVPGAFGWHADSRHILLLTSLAGPFIPQARTIDIQEGHWTNWTVHQAVAQRFLATKLWIPGGETIRWSHGGDVIFFIGDVQGFRSLWRLDVDEKAHEITNGPYRVTPSVEANNFSLSRDGSRLVFGASNRAARLWSYLLDKTGRPRDGSQTAITPEAVHAVSPDLTLDGDRLVFTLARPGSRLRRELVTRQLSTGREQTLRVLDDDRGAIWFPRWNRDGTRLSYTVVTRRSATIAEQQMLLFDPASNRETALTSPTSADTIELGNNWTPDDHFIVSSSSRYRPGQSAIALLRLSDAPTAEKSARIITASAQISLNQASMSPDG